MTGQLRVTPEYLRAWGTHTHGSPLYQHLIGVIATDTELLRVINRIENQPPPNMLLGGVHYLLMKTPSEELAGFYASLTGDPRPFTQVDEAFTQFVLANEETLVELGRTRFTQTNECRRCVALLPGILWSGFDAFHLIEVGTSAGLNLGIDTYAFNYGGAEWGPDSAVKLVAESKGADFEFRDFEVLSRVGIDLNPIDPTNDDERLWLEALIWPEHSERRERLKAALELVATLDIRFERGDALDLLGPVLDELPPGEPAIVMNSFVLIQFTNQQRARLEEIVDLARSARPIHRVSLEALIKSRTWAYLSVNDGSGMREIGQAHPHGEWIDLYA